MDDEKQWYTNKDLFEKLNDLKTEFNGLRTDMYETRVLITSYNGLSEQIEIIRKENANLKTIVHNIINSTEVKKTTFSDLRAWWGWIFGLITLLILIYKTFI